MTPTSQELTARRLVQGVLNELTADKALLSLPDEAEFYKVNSSELKTFDNVPLDLIIETLEHLDYRIIGARTIKTGIGPNQRTVFIPRQLVLWRRQPVDELFVFLLHERRTVGFIWMTAQCFVHEVLDTFENHTGRPLRHWPGGSVFNRVRPELMRELERYGPDTVALFHHVVKGKHRRIVSY